MRVTFLGTGAAGGVPLYGCTCPACLRAHQDTARVRRPCSALIEDQGVRLLIDAGLTDLHERFAPGDLDAIILTHYHPDHVQGLFHLRWGKGRPIPVYGPPDREGCADLFKHPGLLAITAASKFRPFSIGPLQLTPLPLIHSKLTFGYAIENRQGQRFAYLTDTRDLPPACTDFLRDWGPFDMALDCSSPPDSEGRNHNDWHLAHHCASVSGARLTWLTHIGHRLDHWLLEHPPRLPGHLRIAMDGVTHVVESARQ